MSESSERILRFLTGKENIEDVSILDLQKLADENPFFPVSQFLLAKKLKAESNIDYSPQVQKTVLYFSNPFWLHYQLIKESGKEISDNNDDSIIKNEITDKEEVSISEEEPVGISIINLEKESDFEKTDQPAEEMAAITREPETTTEIFLNEAAGKDANQNDNNEQISSKNQNHHKLETAELSQETAETLEEVNQIPVASIYETETAAQENGDQSSPADNNLFDSNLLKDNKQTEEQDEHEKMFQNIKAMLDATSEEADADTNNAVIPIDPYYTIDYFAAQGIKLELDPNPKDDLGKHLKKFTQWLKQMKKLGPEDAAEIISRRETEADIQKIADSSNTVREVVTEAMASVLEKQGKKEKAIELYNKLSF